MSSPKAEFILGGGSFKPVGWDRTPWEKLKYMLYDPSTGAVLNRTPNSWLRIILFYVVFYSILAAFWLGCLQIFFFTIPANQPRWLSSESLIGANPGVGVRPKFHVDKVDSSLFNLRVQDKDVVPTTLEGEGDSNVDYATRMDLFMKNYKNQTGLYDCGATLNSELSRGKCLFDTSVLGDCKEFPYGFLPVDGKIEPCIFLKTNKIFDLELKAINPEELKDPAYEAMSEELKEIIRAEGETNDNIYFDCAGKYQADRESVVFTYYPANRAIPRKYFPFRGGVYQSPLVAVKVRPVRKGQLLHVECRVWFDGVMHNSKDKEGLAQFEVLVE